MKDEWRETVEFKTRAEIEDKIVPGTQVLNVAEGIRMRLRRIAQAG